MQDQWGMSNVLKVSLQETICTLDGRGWSRRLCAEQEIATKDGKRAGDRMSPARYS